MVRSLKKLNYIEIILEIKFNDNNEKGNKKKMKKKYIKNIN